MTFIKKVESLLQGSCLFHRRYIPRDRIYQSVALALHQIAKRLANRHIHGC